MYVQVLHIVGNMEVTHRLRVDTVHTVQSVLCTITVLKVLSQEAKYVERWPNTASAWAGWSRFDSPVDRYGGVHSLLQCTGVSYLPLG
jgi:hypothetical protein